MGWVRVDDGFYDHPGHASLDLEDWGLWLYALAWSNRNLTDGRLPCAVVRRMDPVGKATGALIDAGRWIKQDDDWIEIHGFLDYQPSAEQIRSKRDRERERWQRRAGSPAAADPSAATPRGVPPDSAPTPTASQPQPQHSAKAESEARTAHPTTTTKPRTRGTRIADPFVVSDDMVAWAEAELPGFDWVRETVRFKDHWLAAPGAKGVKQDWPATWRNWMRRAAEGAFR